MVKVQAKSIYQTRIKGTPDMLILGWHYYQSHHGQNCIQCSFNYSN